ncbi:MAG: ATP-binding cassette domain-containing protein [Coriobacteriales bacterium]|jgi:ATPase subunit of ABC transporter with duplicated ATPase domains|nr:ATP-binding cassette domain-containing protein [Coriobacteriales bacterium]
MENSMQITLTTITYSYDDSPDQALVPVTATFPEGWTGIVGSNGSGKTTLLRLLSGELRPTGGRMAPRLVGVYCAQETERQPAGMEDFALDFGGEALRVRRVLGIEDDWPWRYGQLSEGERKRLQVAVALWQNPLVLALDEPTNHVDAACRERLLAALAAYQGVGLLVSHDRELLDALTGQCLFLGKGKATMRPGNYSQGREQEDLARGALLRERHEAKADLARLRQVKAERDHEAARADARRSKRNISPGDHDAKARIDLAIYTGQDGKAGKRSVQMDARLTAAQSRLEQAQVEKVYAADVWLDAEPSHRRILVDMEEGCLMFGTGERLSPLPTMPSSSPHPSPSLTSPPPAPSSPAPLPPPPLTSCLRIPHLTVGPADHIALTGFNGAGKSTLVAALLRALPVDLRLLSVPQELGADERRGQLAMLKELSPARRGRALSIVAQLNSDPERVLSGTQASPGETRKLMLALGILAHPQIIVMDEPTNHLDLVTTEALETMLAACPCALVLVSHDARFLDATTTIRWQISSAADGSGSVLEVML